MRRGGNQRRAARASHGGTQGEHRPTGRGRCPSGRAGPGSARPASGRCPGRHPLARHRPRTRRRTDRLRGGCLGQRPERAPRGALGAARAAPRPAHARRRILLAHALAHAAHRAAVAPRACARGSSRAGDGHGFPGVGIGRARIRRIAGLQRRRLPPAPSHARRHRRDDGALRRAPACPGAGEPTILGRQPAEAGAGARARAGPARASRGAAHARRGYRRHRIHPRAAARAARRRLRDPPRLQRAGRDPHPRRSRAGDERRAHHRRARDRSVHRSRAGAAHGAEPSAGTGRGRVSAAPALPRWADIVVLPLVNLGMALLVAGLVGALLRPKPWDALSLLVKGAFGTTRGFSYTLYYTTTFIFTGLAVAVAAHGGLFNIGAEGQALLGGLGAGLVALWLANDLPAAIVLPLMVVASASFGAGWAAVPAYLQAYRGSHIVITTIMFNFIANTLLVYLLVNVLKAPGSMAVGSAAFGPAALPPTAQEALAPLGVEWPSSPLNLSFFLALLAAVGA